MKVKTLTLNSPLFPEQLQHIADPPRQLYYLGDLENVLNKPRLAIVGSRKVSAYGKSVTHKLVKEAAPMGSSAEESILIELLIRDISDSSEPLHHSKFASPTFNQTLTMLEITGKIRPLGAGHWSPV